MTSLATMRLELAGPLARLTLERAEVLNAGDARFARDLKAAVATLGARPEVRVIALTGAGRAFSTGVDLTALAHGEVGLADFIAWEDAMTAMERMDKLFIAGINGHCREPEERLIPSMSLWRLPRLIGLARAKELILLGESVSARTAERYGVVNRVVAAGDFAPAFEATIERFLALPPASARASKVLATRAFDVDFEAFRKEMETLLAGCLESAEHRRAMAEIRARKPRAR